MAQVDPVYQEIPEFLQIADKLIEAHPDLFANIDVATIACCGITNKDRSEKKTQLWELKAIKPPISLFCPKSYVVVFFQKDWDSLSEKHRHLITADVLCSIPPGGGGDIKPMDYKDHSVMLRTFGVDYMNRSDVPDLLSDTDKIDWKK